MATTEFASRERLLLFAVLLPAVVAGANQFIIRSAALFSDWLRPWLVYTGFSCTTALLSWCVGRYLSPNWLQWIVFAWCLILLDIWTIATCLCGPLPREFAFVLISAQVVLILLWTILADVRWQWRLPGTAVAASLVVLYASNWLRNTAGFGVLVIIAAVLITIVCASFRWRGFALKRTCCESKPSYLVQTHQFGIKHLLVWATSMAPLLFVARGLDFLIFSTLDRQALFPAMLIALATALVTLVAVWTVLGTGNLVMRVIAMLIVPVFAAIALDYYGEYSRPPLGMPWPQSPILWLLWRYEDSWATWLWPKATLLAALLLFLRASGHRLERMNT